MKKMKDGIEKQKNKGFQNDQAELEYNWKEL